MGVRIFRQEGVVELVDDLASVPFHDHRRRVGELRDHFLTAGIDMFWDLL